MARSSVLVVILVLIPIISSAPALEDENEVITEIENKDNFRGSVWVNMADWEKMPGGKANNPPATVWKAQPYSRCCAKIKLSSVSDKNNNEQKFGQYYQGDQDIFTTYRIRPDLYNGKVHYVSADGNYVLYYDPTIYNSTGAFKFVPQHVKGSNYDWNTDHQYFNVSIWSGKNNKECPNESTRWQLKGEEKLMYSNGPVVKCIEEPKSCRYLVQWRHQGSWQTGCAEGNSTHISFENGGAIANKDFFCCDKNVKGFNDPNNYRIFINPGNSSSFEWLEWEKGKNDGKFPKNVVYGDEEAKLIVASFYNSWESSDHFAVVRDEDGNKIQGAQVDASGTAFYTHGRKNWYQSPNKFMILVELAVKDYELLNITFGGANKVKQPDSVSGHIDCNHSNQEQTYHSLLEFITAEESSWTHGISWSLGSTTTGKVIVGASIPLLAKAEAELSTSLSLGFGGQHGWGRSLKRTKKNHKKVIHTVPPKHCGNVTMTVSSMKADLPFVAKIKIKYADGRSKIVEDNGTWKGVVYTNFKSSIQEASCALVDGEVIDHWTGSGMCKEEPTKNSKDILGAMKLIDERGPTEDQP